jgi:hypothetical protein
MNAAGTFKRTKAQASYACRGARREGLDVASPLINSYPQVKIL